MITLNAREIANKDVSELWKMPDQKVKLVFEDGDIITFTRAITFSHYYWLPHRLHPKTPMLKSHFVGNKSITPKTHMKLCGNVVFDTYKAYGGSVDTDELSKIVYLITNQVYNEMTVKLEAWVTSIDILDFIEIMDNPNIEKIMDEVQPNSTSIAKAYQDITKTLESDESLSKNDVRLQVNSRLTDVKQVHQNIGIKGYGTDIDGRIFPNPIMTGFARGFTTLHDSLIESRSGAKALMFAKEPLQQTEYFNRRMQLSITNIRNLHHGDCGTKHTVMFHVHAADLPALVGKYYVDKGKLREIREDDKHLIGKVINMRSTMVCEHEDPYGVCSTCMGALALSVPHGTNIGHVAATELCSPTTQKVLSTKHLDMSATAIELYISDYDRRYIALGSDNTNVFINPSANFDKMEILVAREDAKHIEDVAIMDNIADLVPSKVTTIKHVVIRTHGSKGVTEDIVPVASSTGSSSLTPEMLLYMKEKGWGLEENGDYVIDLSDWDKSKPVFALPMKDMNMLEFMNSISTMVESSVGGRKKKKKSERTVKALTDYDSLSAALASFHELVSSKVFVNIAHLEIIIKSCMIRDGAERDFRLPLPNQRVEFGKFTDLVEGRSLSAQMPYQNQANTLVKPFSYVNKNRGDHDFDVYLTGRMASDVKKE